RIDLSDLRRAVPQHNTGGVQASLAAYLRRLCVPQLVRVPRKACEAGTLADTLQPVAALLAVPASAARARVNVRLEAAGCDGMVIGDRCVMGAGGPPGILLGDAGPLARRQRRLALVASLGIVGGPSLPRLEQVLRQVQAKPRAQQRLSPRADQHGAG